MIVLKIDLGSVVKNPEYGKPPKKVRGLSSMTFEATSKALVSNALIPTIKYEEWVGGVNYFGVETEAWIDTYVSLKGVVTGADLRNLILRGKKWEGITTHVSHEYIETFGREPEYKYSYEKPPKDIKCSCCGSQYGSGWLDDGEYCPVCGETIIEYEEFDPKKHAKDIEG